MKAIVIVDMQNDFITGSLGTKEAQAIIPKVSHKIQQYAQLGNTLFATYDSHGDDYLDTLEGKNLPVQHCISGTKGFHMNPIIFNAIQNWNKVGCKFYAVEKNTFGSYDLPNTVHLFCNDKLEEIVIMGLCTEFCVISNAIILKSFFPNVRISIESSCCAGATPEGHERALKVLETLHFNVID